MIVKFKSRRHGSRNLFAGDNVEKARDPQIPGDAVFKEGRRYLFGNDVPLPAWRENREIDLSYVG